MAELTGTQGPYDVAHLGAALEAIQGSSRGYLAVCDGTRDVCVLFGQGGLRITARGFALPRLGDWLEVQGELRPDEAQRLQRLRGDDHADERELLTAAQVSEARIEKGARSLMGRVVLDALCWDAPHCDSNVGEAPFVDQLWGPGVQVLRATTGMQPLIEGLLGRLREVDGVLAERPSLEVSVLTTSESKARERLGDAEETLEGRLLAAVLAKPGIHGDQLLEQLGCGEIALLSMLAALVRLELLKVSPLKRDESGRIEQAELALRRSLAELPRRTWLGQVTLDAGDRPGAARHLARAGWLLVDQRRHREAHERFGEALSQAPEHLAALRGRVHVLWELDRAEEAAEDSGKLGRALLDAKLPTHARQVLDRATRAREKLHLEQLLLEAYVELGDRRGIQSLGRSLLVKLEKKGRGAEVDAVKALLADEATQGGAPVMHVPQRRASAALKASSAFACCAALGLGAWAWLSWSELVERRAYAQASSRAQAQLGEDVDLDELEQLFPASAATATAAGVAVADLRDELALLRKDQESATWLNNNLRYAWEQDVEKVIRILDGVDAETLALRRPVRALRERADAHLDEARNLQRRLQGVTRDRNLDRAYRMGRRLLDEFKNVPSVIQDRKRSRVPIKIDSEPTGALVSWQGVQVGATPMIVELNLIDSSALELQRQDHATVELEVRFDELGGPELRVTLPPAEGE